MKRTGRVPFMRLQVGLLVLASFVLILWATFQSGRLPFFGGEEEMRITFPNAMGLEEEAAVRLNGVPVGHVRKIALHPEGNDVIVTLGVDPGTRSHIHEGATARITTVGFLSELYVALDGGDLHRPVIHDDAQIQGEGSADPQVLYRKMEGMGDSLDVLLGNLNRAGRKLGSGQGTLGKLSEDERLYDRMVELSRTATELATRLNENQIRVSDRLVALASTLDSLAWRMQHGEGTVAQVMNSGELYQRLLSGTTRLDSVLAVIQSGRGGLGRVYADSTLYDDTKALMASMKRLMSEIEKNPKKYLKFSIF